MKWFILLVQSISFFSLTANAATEAPLVSIDAQNNFFNSISKLCGKAFEGKIKIDNSPSSSFKDKKLVMHVRKCSDSQIQIPFHVGEDSSRTWIITKTGSGLSLKHDHRHKDGSHDELTMYGGHSIDRGWPQVQSFPADQYSIELFIAKQIPQSIDNVWQFYIYPDTFSYRLVRKAREFQVDFDLSKEVKAPKAPWGYSDK